MTLFNRLLALPLAADTLGDDGAFSFLTSDEVVPQPVNLKQALDLASAYVQGIYLRSRWGDEWLPAPWLHCTQANWVCAPSVSTAQLVWDFGAIARERSLVSPLDTIISPRDIDRWFVKIVFTTEPYKYRNSAGDWVTARTREWVGLVAFTDHKVAGDMKIGDLRVASGEQLITCFGMERLLVEKYITKSVWEKTPADPETEEPGETADADFLFPFNPLRRGQQTGNRSEHPIVDGESEIYVFSKDPLATHKWTHEQIVEYLLHYHNPTGTDEDSEPEEHVDFALDADAAIIELEPPELDPTGQTLHGLLCRLIDRRRLVVWWCEYDGGTNRVLIKTATMTATNLVLPIKGSPLIPKNREQRLLYVNEDPATSWADRWPALDMCDQVLVRGARRQSVGTFSIGEATLEKGWSAEQETAYQKAASETDGYDALGRAEQQRRNADARSRPELGAAHSAFRIPKTWVFTTGDGAAGGSMKPTFPDDEDPTVALPVNYREMFVQGQMPMKEGVSYNSLLTRIDDETPYTFEIHATGRLISPIVVLKVPKKAGDESADRWVLAHKMGQNAALETRHKKENHRFSCHIEVPEYYPGFYLKVAGEPQHVIAFTAFTPLPADPPCGQWDYYDGMRATLCVPDDRYVQGVYPTTPPADVDALRVKVIEAGERYRKDYIVPNTIVDVDPAGALVLTDGGYLPEETDEDDEHQLKGLAKIAWNWYGKRHHVVSLDSYRILPKQAVGLGQLVTTIGNRPDADDEITANTLEVNSVITQIVFTWPKGVPINGHAPRPMLHLDTWAGELEHEPLKPNPLIPSNLPYLGPTATNTLNAKMSSEVLLQPTGRARLGIQKQ